MLKKMLLLSGVFIIASCSNVPSEAPQLSQEVGKRLNAIEQAHLRLLHSFMDDKRRQIDRFFEDVWTPKFAENFFNRAPIQNLWEQVVASDDANDRLQFIIRVAPVLQREINAHRMKVIQPLDDLQRELETQLRSEYQLARQMNTGVTSLLQSAVDADAYQNKLLSFVGLDRGKIQSAISRADAQVSQLMTVKSTVDAQIQAFSAFTDGITAIKEEIAGEKPLVPIPPNPQPNPFIPTPPANPFGISN